MSDPGAAPLRVIDRLSLGSLVVANVAAIGLGLWQDWPLGSLLWPYWVQSVVIGWYSRRRILSLKRFSTEGFKVNNRPVEPTPETQRSTANFFAVHYGAFHLAYLIFLLTFSFGKVKGFSGTIDPLDWLGIGAASVAFVVNHHMSYRRHRESDSRGCPNIGTLMFLPYARIVPMHLVIIVGASMGGAGSLLLFGALKTGADALMHGVEHRALAGAGTRASDA